MEDIKILSVNIAGLKINENKFINEIRETDYDIICIQEVHKYKPKDQLSLNKILNSKSYYDVDNETKSFFQGVGIILRSKMANKPYTKIQIKDNDLKNRILHIQIGKKKS